MAVTTQYSDSAPQDNKQDAWKSIGQLAAEAVRKAVKGQEAAE